MRGRPCNSRLPPPTPTRARCSASASTLAILAGATIDPVSGVFSWTPTEAQGPGTYEIGVQVVDDGSPPEGDSRTFTIRVAEVNLRPALAPIPAQTVLAGHLVTFAASGSDADLPEDHLTYGLRPWHAGRGGHRPDDGRLHLGPAPGTPSTVVTIRVSDRGKPPLRPTLTVPITVINPSPTTTTVSDVRLATSGRGAKLSTTFLVSFSDALEPPRQAISATIPWCRLAATRSSEPGTTGPRDSARRAMIPRRTA